MVPAGCETYEAHPEGVPKAFERNEPVQRNVIARELEE